MKKILLTILFIFLFAFTSFSKDITVAVVGSGINYFDTKIHAKLWTNTKEIPDNGIDDDGNGYIDDVNGWNFVFNDNDIHSHLTNDYHESAVIQDMLNYNNQYIYETDNITIMPLKIRDGDNICYAEMEDVAEYAIKNKADIISLSLSFDMDNPGEFDELVQKYSDILIIRAAGNDNENYSSNKRNCTGNTFSNLIVVGALDSEGNLAKYSNYGTGVDTYIDGDCHSISKSTLYDKLDGTSFAVPKIVSQCCQIINYYPEAKPQQIKNFIVKMNNGKKYLQK